MSDRSITPSATSCVANCQSLRGDLIASSGDGWEVFFASRCAYLLNWQSLNYNNLKVHDRSQYSYGYDDAVSDCLETADIDESVIFEFETDTRNSDR